MLNWLKKQIKGTRWDLLLFLLALSLLPAWTLRGELSDRQGYVESDALFSDEIFNVVWCARYFPNALVDAVWRECSGRQQEQIEARATKHRAVVEAYFPWTLPEHLRN